MPFADSSEMVSLFCFLQRWDEGVRPDSGFAILTAGANIACCFSAASVPSLSNSFATQLCFCPARFLTDWPFLIRLEKICY